MDPALSTLLRYFEAVEQFDLDSLVQCFTEDGIYHHPSYRGFPGHEDDDPDGWHQAVGRSELKDLFQMRGRQDAKHHVTAFAREGDICFNEGYAIVNGDPNYVSFVAIFRVNDAGLIREYQAYSHRPRRPLLGSDTPIRLEE
jgi:hypothetical protein